MADFNAPPGLLSQIIARLRGVSQGGPGPQADGYRLYVQEQQAQGLQPVSYEQWIAQQGPLSGQK